MSRAYSGVVPSLHVASPRPSMDMRYAKPNPNLGYLTNAVGSNGRWTSSPFGPSERSGFVNHMPTMWNIGELLLSGQLVQVI